MVFDSPTDRQGGRDNLNPMHIANNPLLSVREKLDLLRQLKAESAGQAPNADEVAFSPEEIDAALAEVHARALSGESSEPPLGGLR